MGYGRSVVTGKWMLRLGWYEVTVKGSPGVRDMVGLCDRALLR